MNCATHNDVAAVAFCRTCGKPLCNQCTRDVRGVIYCESCLAARMEGAAPAGAYTSPAYTPPAYTPPAQKPYQPVVDPGTGFRMPPPQTSGPNPTVAGMLAGIFPIGVGAVYCSQYAKGLAHLVIMVMLIIGETSDVPWYVHMVLGIGIGFFWIYQVIDAARTARAIQLGEPIPDPFGLGLIFGSNSPVPPSGSGIDSTLPRGEPTRIPVAAAVLIGLGVLFLMSTTLDFSMHRFWPLILIVLGVYAFAKNWGLLGSYRPACVCERCRTRRLMGPAILVTLGVLFLLDSTSDVGFGRTWPALLLVIGVVKLMQSNASGAGHVGPLPPGPTGFPPTPPPSAPAVVTHPPQSAPPDNPSNAAPTDPSSGEVKNV